ncbi:MAG: ester cyclase, partial [Actinomycetota bacterium]
MSTEENKTLTRRFTEEVLNTGNVAATDEFVAPDVTIHMPGQPPVRGREAFKQLAAAYFAAFPHLHETTEDEIAAGDKVARR